MLLSEDALRNLLDHLGIDVVSETGQDYICYCPLHTNRDSPALNVMKEYPYGFRCWNPVCGQSGSLQELVSKVNNSNVLESMRFITSFRSVGPEVLEAGLKSRLKKKKEKVLDESVLVKLTPEKENLKTLFERGFSQATLDFFQVGFSKRKERVTIPLRGPDGELLGWSGRAIYPWQKPKYLETTGYLKSRNLFNIHNAKKFDEIILVEGPLDTMKVHQAGYPNVTGTLGSSLSDPKIRLLQEHANAILIFTDNDEPGRKLAKEAERRLDNKKLFWATYPEGNLKDPGQMSEDEIRQAIEGKKSKIEIMLEKIRKTNKQ